jgi:hypothetical protein
LADSGDSPARAALRRLAPLAMPAAYSALTLLVFWKLWTPIDGARGSWRFDPLFEYWQDLVFQLRSLGDGVIALWNPHDRGGFPLYGDPQPGMFYPVNWLLLLVSAPLGEVIYPMISVKILLHWAFGSIGMHLFLRRLGAPEPACYVGGVLVSFTAPRMRMGGSALNWSTAWLPWVLLALHWFADKPSPRRAIVLGTTVAMVLLAGAPAVLMYALIIAAFYGAWLLRGRYRASWKPVAISIGVFALWVLPLVASNLEQLPETVRESRNLAFVTDSVFPPSRFVTFAVPRLPGGESPYVGLLPLLAAGLLVASQARGRALVFVGIAAFGALLGMGIHTGVMPSLASALPPFTLFRRAHRYLYVTILALAVLGGLGLAHAMKIEAEERKRVLGRRIAWVGGAITFALGIAYLISVVLSDKLVTAKNDSFGLAFASAAAATWLLRAIVVSDGRRRTTYAWIAALVVTLDVWTANARAVGGLPKPPSFAHDDVPAELDLGPNDWRIYDYGYVNYRPGTRLGVRDFGGYEDDPLGLSRYRIFLDASKRNLALMGHANVKYYLPGKRRNPKLRPPPGADKIRDGVFRLPATAPAVLYLPDPTPVANARAGIKALAKIVPGQGGVYEGPAPPPGPADARPTAGRITVLEPNHLRAEIETPGPGLIIVNEAYYPGWSATVDGDEVAIQPANVMFRGIPVDSAGRHVIEMRLRPARFWGLLPAFLAGLGLLGWVILAPPIRRWRRRDRDGDSDATA